MKKHLSSTRFALLIAIMAALFTVGNPALAQNLEISYHTPDTAICIGDTIQLEVSATGGSGNYTYSWNSNVPGWSTTTQNPIVWPTANRTYTVVVNDGASSVNATFVLSVLAYPNVDLSAYDALCEGQSLTLQIGTFASILWSNGSTGESIMTDTVGTFWVEVANEAGCVGSDTVVVSEVPLPTVGLGNDTAFCQGKSIILKAPTSSAYLWSSGATTKNLTVNTGGNYWVLITDANGCHNADTVAVTVNPKPIINLPTDTTFCQGGNIVLNPGSGTGSVYLWGNTSTNATLTVSAVGLIKLKVTTVNGCADSVKVNVIKQPDAVSSFVFYENNNHVIFENKSQHAWDFVWDFGDGSALSTEANPEHDYMPNIEENTWHTATLYAANQCMEDTSTADILLFDMDELGVESTISIFPNPNNGIFSLNGKLPGNEEFSVLMFNAIGQEIKSDNFNSFDGQISRNFDLSDLETGLYFFQLQGKNKTHIFKVFIE